MLAKDYLNLRLVRLQAAGQWARQSEGMAFVFPRQGCGHYLRGNVKQPLSPGDVLVVNGDVGARICGSKSPEFTFSGFAVRIDHLFPLFAGTEISLLQSFVDGFKGYKLYPAASQTAQECHRLLSEVSPQLNLNHRAQCLRLAATILNAEFMSAQRSRVGFIRPEDHLVQVFESLSAEDMMHLSVPELSERFGCSRRHLNRLFHQFLGYSVTALRMEVRLMKAVSLLRHADAKVIHVAEQCGFNHLGLFNICFRRRFQTSPGQWRKAMAHPSGSAKLGNGKGPDWPVSMAGLLPRSSRPLDRAEPAVPSGRAPARSAHRPGRKQKLANLGKGDLGIRVAANPKTGQLISFEVRAQP